MKQKKTCATSYTGKKISGVDLFCGAGGLTHGLLQGGIRINAGIDMDPSCRFPYERNNRAFFLEKNIRQLKAAELTSFFDKNTLRLLAGCAPCQPFSTYNSRKTFGHTHGKWDLLLDFARIVKELQPELVTMENVPPLLKHQVFELFLEAFSGYHLWYDVVDCVCYGIPQTRKRLVLLASKLGEISLIPPTHTKTRVTVQDVISKLPHLEAGQTDTSDLLHTAPSLSDLNLQRIQASKPGGTWRDWPVNLQTRCHKRKSGETYSSVYGRMEWSAPAPTITTQCFGFGNGRFGHPEQNRAISLREAAILQTFPENYQFTPPDIKARFNVLGRLIGNAVPVRLGKVIANSFVIHVNNILKSNVISED